MDVRLRASGRLHRLRACKSATHREFPEIFCVLNRVDTNLLNYLYQSSRWMTDDMLQCSNRHRLLAVLSISCRSVALPATESSILESSESMAAQISENKSNYIFEAIGVNEIDVGGAQSTDHRW